MKNEKEGALILGCSVAALRKWRLLPKAQPTARWGGWYAMPKLTYWLGCERRVATFYELPGIPADRHPPQAIPRVAHLAVGDTVYLGYRDGGQIQLLGRMRIG